MTGLITYSKAYKHIRCTNPPQKINDVIVFNFSEISVTLLRYTVYIKDHTSYTGCLENGELSLSTLCTGVSGVPKK